MADDKIIIADYIIYPPYQMAEKGLTSDFINVLESRLPNLSFMSKRITKERLLALLKQNKPVLIPFAQKSWFDSNNQFAQSTPLIEEDVHIISHRDKSLEPDKIVAGSLFLGLNNYNYQKIDELVNTGRIKRYSCASDDLCLTMLLAKRGDFLVMAKGTFERFTAAKSAFKNNLYISEQPFYQHHRALLAANISHQDWQQILSAIEGLNKDPSWQQIKQSYGFNLAKQP